MTKRWFYIQKKKRERTKRKKKERNKEQKEEEKKKRRVRRGVTDGLRSPVRAHRALNEVMELFSRSLKTSSSFVIVVRLR
jgi:hypothetical protein